MLQILFFLVCFIVPSLEAIVIPKEVPTERPTRKLLVTGCARSGTLYITKVLRKCGLKVLHEKVDEDGAVSWFMAVDSDIQPPIGPRFNSERFEHVFHQVRCPIKTIASVWVNEPRYTWKFIEDNIPQISKNDSRLMRCVKYWMYWNKSAESLAELTYRVEDIEEVLPIMSEILGMPMPVEAAREVSNKTNHRLNYEYVFTWEDLEELLPSDLFAEFREQATRYGY